MRLEIGRALAREQSGDPGMLLASCTFARALRAVGLLRSGVPGFVICVVPRGYRTEEYEAAAFAMLKTKRDDWGDQQIKVRLANPPRKKGVPHRRVSIFDLKGLEVLVARDIGEVPKDVRFAATAIVRVERPTPGHVNAARRLSGRAPFSREVAALLAAKPQNALLAAILQPNSVEGRIDELDDLNRESSGPGLFELPGYEELKPWARRLSADVARWRSGKLSWSLVTRGALISGPPGTGKTLFASALANALGFKLISATVGRWQAAGHLDDTLAAMQKSFRDADDGVGAVLFIDEFDSIGRRSARPGHHNDHYWQIVLNDFLSLLTNLGDGVVVVGATNFPEWIDPAILRAGRLENHFELTLPDRTSRAGILKHHAGDAISLDSLSGIAEDLEGASGADLERLVRDARGTARGEDRDLELRDIIDRLPERKRRTAEQQLRLAVHEAGHALVALALGYATSATIEIRDSFDPNATEFLGGLASYTVVPDYLPTETSLRNRIAVSYAGMAAEAAVFGDRSLGSGGIVGSDVEHATSIARRMIGSYGLGKTPIFLGTPGDLGNAPLPERQEAEVTQMLSDEWERVRAMLAGELERLLDLAAEVVANQSVRIERGGIAKAA
ncbi:AAA family ATPase [Rhizobium sp. NLR8a]|uniref:AAA family ATPase n=1 Tax=Rhizobium sp. NLR8a TaxID=2731119 RepID=UPI001C82C9EC|nr:AAA family ATPase [Rhizobium sp. NLR8a]MBX5218753.1 AAA family ATPase [Rhizobium sp. NLR8a]